MNQPLKKIEANPEAGAKPAEMGILDHLRELRTRLVYSILAIIALGIVWYSWSIPLFNWLAAPFLDAFPGERLVGMGPADALTLKIKVSFFAGAVTAAPVVFYQIWRFIAPGLHDHERKWVIPFILVTTASFLVGVWFCYSQVLPYSYDFFFEEYQSIGLEPQVTLSAHLGLTMQLLLAFGLIFELPTLSFVFARLGLLTFAGLRDAFRYVVVGIFVIAAVLTPPDVISQLLMAGPMIVLYGLSLVIVKFTEQKPLVS